MAGVADAGGRAGGDDAFLSEIMTLEPGEGNDRAQLA
jgi:hypothetical protein